LLRISAQILRVASVISSNSGLLSLDKESDSPSSLFEEKRFSGSNLSCQTFERLAKTFKELRKCPQMASRMSYFISSTSSSLPASSILLSKSAIAGTESFVISKFPRIPSISLMALIALLTSSTISLFEFSIHREFLISSGADFLISLKSRIYRVFSLISVSPCSNSNVMVILLSSPNNNFCCSGVTIKRLILMFLISLF